MRLARDASNREIDAAEFTSRSESLISQYPELQAMSWIDDRRRFKANYAAPSVHPAQQHALDEVLRQSGQFGPRVEVPDDADEQTKLIAFIGRQP